MQLDDNFCSGRSLKKLQRVREVDYLYYLLVSFVSLFYFTLLDFLLVFLKDFCLKISSDFLKEYLFF